MNINTIVIFMCLTTVFIAMLNIFSKDEFDICKNANDITSCIDTINNEEIKNLENEIARLRTEIARLQAESETSKLPENQLDIRIHCRALTGVAYRDCTDRVLEANIQALELCPQCPVCEN